MLVLHIRPIDRSLLQQALSLCEHSDLNFPSLAHRPTPCDMALTKVLRDSRLAHHATAHGLCSSFRPMRRGRDDAIH